MAERSLNDKTIKWNRLHEIVRIFRTFAAVQALETVLIFHKHSFCSYTEKDEYLIKWQFKIKRYLLNLVL